MKNLGFTYAGSSTVDEGSTDSTGDSSSTASSFLKDNSGIVIAIVAALLAFAFLKAIEK
jgi:hypothetical protein